MIVRKLSDGSLILINQTDHASVSGIMGAHWGNGDFKKPAPFESVVRGVALHDAGWRRYETAPHYDMERQTPPHFTATPLTVNQVASYQDAVDWLWKIDPYAGLLISRHRTGLWRRRYDAVNQPAPSAPRAIIPEAEQFIARNEARQEEALAQFDRRAFHVNYQLLQILDLLSLYLCTGEPTKTQIGPAPMSCDGDGTGVPLSLEPLGYGRISIRPYPFDEQPLKVSIIHRFMPSSIFPSEDAFRQAYFGAAPKTMEFEFV